MKQHWQKYCQDYRVILLGAVILLHACATGPPLPPTSEDTYSFTVKYADADEIPYICGRGTKACIFGSAIVMEGDKPNQRFGATFVSYPQSRGPCECACVIDGKIHVDDYTFGRYCMVKLGDAIIDVTGVGVPRRQAEILGHEAQHRRGLKH